IGSAAITGFSNPGRTRQLSILNGLRDIDTYVKSLDKNDDPVVIIHDAARPNLTAEYLNRCLDAIEGCDGVMPTLPMKDTVYYSENGTKVDKLLDRSCIFAGQAPELYRLKKYLEANEKLLPDDILKINGSTEPAVMAGLNVAMIPGDENNYKVTTKKDMDRFIQDIVLKSQFAAWEQ
ncbi:MAG: 2-C-methyl-D-erythritol 4-phosphate cytidylyltransferase, partial [Lachnospiraceae bacterium]|nr:2-C-methyl-D-erythritol 4-phosphate cytidylyltransferase [Lachnospiraceae bacterium]